MMGQCKVDPQEAAGAQGQRKRVLLFQYPSLPRLELISYFAVLISTLIYAWSRIYLASGSYKWSSSSIWETYEDVEWPFGMGKYRRDTTNYEWRLWTMYARKALLWFIGHSILFNIGESFLPQRIWRLIMLVYWLIAHVVITSRMVIMVAVALGLVTYTVARCTRSKVLTWLVGVGLLYWSSAMDTFVVYDVEGYGYYITVIVFPYKMVQYLTYCTEMLGSTSHQKKKEDGKEKKKEDAKEKKKEDGKVADASRWLNSFLDGLFAMLWYSFYLPYSCHLIVTYKRFPDQLAARSSKTGRNWRNILVFGLRMAFWAALAELLCYVFYFEAMMSNSDFLSRVSEDTLVSIGYAVGQFFHLKYVLVFGVPAFFARLDNMDPWPGPICITRVALYSKIWRYFDRGLYDFFKEYIFMPICRPTFSIGRKIFGVLVSYAFVLIWHGTDHQYVVWIILNIAELVLESIAKIVYSIPAVKEFRESYISDRNFRRILAWLQVIPFAFGLYSNFYFLGSSESGYVFVERIFWQETVPVNWPFLVLIFLGYCYSHVCMEVDRWQSQTSGKDEEEKKKL